MSLLAYCLLGIVVFIFVGGFLLLMIEGPSL